MDIPSDIPCLQFPADRGHKMKLPDRSTWKSPLLVLWQDFFDFGQKRLYRKGTTYHKWPKLKKV
jgi:hypothetical protein